jgi:peptide-methionine (S)-S-oxide reductase
MTSSTPVSPTRPSLVSKALRPMLLAGAAIVATAAVVLGHGTSSEATPLAAPARMPAAAYQPAATGATETAVLSGGCFWGVQGVFEHVRGVKQVLAGYAGGYASTANYELVSTGTTGHAESVKIVFDPAQISYGEILRIFFSVATDPTQVGGQFPDVGSQYRTEIFYTTPAQQVEAQRYIAQLTAAKAFARPIVTRVDPLKGFFEAESYHQDYLFHHPDQPYIAAYDLPKVAALKALFPGDWRGAPVLTLAMNRGS